MPARTVTSGRDALRGVPGLFSRPAAPADASCGVLPQLVVEPDRVEQVAAALAVASRQGVSVVPRGGGSKLEWGDPPPKEHVVMSTTRLTGVLDHAAADMIVVARAGTTLGGLQRAVGSSRQRLSLDPPESGATLGGIVATNAAGPLRLRYGRPRDLLIGVQAVLSDGTVARAGGRVVKNVAGYDLGKLYAGSFGTLGVIVETTFRLHPLPVSAAVALLEVQEETSAVSFAERALNSQLEAAAITLHWQPAGPSYLEVRLEGGTSGVLARRQALEEMVCATPGIAPATGGPPSSEGAPCILHLGFRPGDLAAVMEELRSAADAEGVRATAAFEPGVGTADVQVWGEGAALVRLVARLRERLAGRTHTHLRKAPLEVLRSAGAWDQGGLPIDLLSAIKRRFDPAGILAPGRLPGTR